jgi:two-component system, LytTR family, response regulator
MNPPAPLRVIIVEDIISFREDLEKFLHQQPEFTLLGACATVYEALIMIRNTKPDLLLLDIELPDGTGFDILEQMGPVRPKVIFLTAQKYALRAIRCGAIDYLLKPYNEDELRDALQKVLNAQPLLEEQIKITLESYRKKKQDQLALSSQQIVQIVEVKDICYLQSDSGYTTIFLNGGKKVVTTKILKYYVDLLPEKSFLHVHQSYLVNEFYIARYHKKDGLLYLKDSTEIPVSYRKKELIHRHFKMLLKAPKKVFDHLLEMAQRSKKL